MSPPVPLIRRFTTIPGASRSGDVDLSETWLLHGEGRQIDWNHLQSQSRAVILADAGAGKTFELRAKAESLADRGVAAFFIRIEHIHSEFENAFEVGNSETFRRWLSGTGKAWFFLDSVDEVRLETPRAFEMAMRAFVARIQDARHRAHIIISSRPYAWRCDLDGALIDELLPYAHASAETNEGDESAEEESKSASSAKTIELYRLAPLDRDQIRIFSGHRQVQNVSDFLDALERNALYGLAQLPFDLEDLITIWNQTGALDSRLAVLERGIRQRLGGSRVTPSRLTLDLALQGARRLALATTLIGEANIRLPEGVGTGVDVSAILEGWSSEDIRELLSRGIFSDAIYSMVRFRHRETRELLAAQGLAEALHRPETRPDIEELIFRKIYGETVVVPRLRPLLPWLILFDNEIRDRTITLRAEIAIEGGDPAQLPLAIRVTFLRNMVAGIVSKANRGGDNSEIARIAQPDLEETVNDLLENHADNDDVIFFLGRLIWQGNMRAAAGRLGPIARDPGRGIYARIVSVRAIMSVGTADQRETLWTALQTAAEPLPQRLLAELVNNASADSQSVGRLVDLLGHLEPYARFTMTGLGQAIHDFVDRLPMMSDCAVERPLVHLVTGLARYLFQEPFVHQGRECRVSQEYSWLMAPAIHTVERLVVGKSCASFDPASLNIQIQAFTLRHHGGFEDREYKTKLGELVPRWVELNDTLFWHAVAQTRESQKAGEEPLTDLWKIEWLGHFWRFDDSTFTRTLDWVRIKQRQEDRSLALSRSFQTYVENGRPRRWRDALWQTVRGSPLLEAKLSALMRPPRNPERERWRADRRRWARRSQSRVESEAHARAIFVARLKANPEDIRNPPGLRPGEMSQGQFHLLNSIKGDGLHFSRSGGEGWEALIPEFGEAVAQSFRDAAVRQWRAFEPGLRSEGADYVNIPHALIFAMTGLDIEAGPDGHELRSLSGSDAQRAMRYALREINGFPSWFEPLFRDHRERGIDLIWGEVRWELKNSDPDKPMHYVLHDLVYHAPWLHADLAELIRSWLLEYGAPNHDALRHARAIMVGGGLPPEAMAVLAQVRVQASVTPEAQLPTWLAIWVDVDPTRGIDTLEMKLSSLDRATATILAEKFLTALTGDRSGSGDKIGAWQTAHHLRRLYILMHSHIRVAEDINRSEGGTYSPTARDDAQHARNHLFNILADIPGEPTYSAIQQLALDHPEFGYRAYMGRAARDRATADSERTWTEREASMMLNRIFDPRRN